MPEARIIVVDDHSSDGTAQAARMAGAEVLPVAHHIGAWASTQTGIRFAVEQDADIIITMDADGQHAAQDLDKLIQPVLGGQADVTIGTCVTRGSAMRRVAWVLLRYFSGIRLSDLTSGYRVYNRQASVLLASWQASLLTYQDIGVLTLLLAHGMRVVDIQTRMDKRHSGHSRLFQTWSRVGYYMAYSLLLGVSKRRLRSYRGTTLDAPPT